ncbi:TetR/AcrR family transcriptional regulator [Actinomadura opuntiae]|uniref:TetR/AcrR family transcriptional regulator n=1 Tax=Actinomadura sp. OS1-43 TaxID=604315 RepID=UPI00255AB740|nr:TetR/AcrR family transcriptional regulator [Actinomadura sp. OS1-43]MDL4817296.1 TetR/AcrR family transcriptional regulator [Actinomadura sp. OS1-43]
MIGDPQWAALLNEAALTPPGEADDTREHILDAALAEAAAVGVNRMTVEDVVRRSRLGRMTVYRRFPRRDDLVKALAVREIQRFLAAVAAGIDRAPNGRAGVAEAFVAAVTFARRHPLLQRLAFTAPGFPLEAVAANDAEVLSMGAAFIAREMHGDRPGAPSREVRWVADTFARLFITYLGVPPADPDVTDDVQLRLFAEHVLTPMVERATAGARP